MDIRHTICRVADIWPGGPGDRVGDMALKSNLKRFKRHGNRLLSKIGRCGNEMQKM